MHCRPYQFNSFSCYNEVTIQITTHTMIWHKVRRNIYIILFKVNYYRRITYKCLFPNYVYQLGCHKNNFTSNLFRDFQLHCITGKMWYSYSFVIDKLKNYSTPYLSFLPQQHQIILKEHYLFAWLYKRKYCMFWITSQWQTLTIKVNV